MCESLTRQCRFRLLQLGFIGGSDALLTQGNGAKSRYVGGSKPKKGTKLYIEEKGISDLLDRVHPHCIVYV
jgi:hypothetical protein